MKPFFGLDNRLSSIFVSFIIFGYAVYLIFSDGLLSTESFRFIRIRDSSNILNSDERRTVQIKYNFDSTTASLFGLYELEIIVVKVCVSFLLFIILLVGATQRSRILLRIWMVVHALVIVLGFLTTILALTDSHMNDTTNGVSTNTLTKFFITLAFSLWFFAVVLSLHEEMEIKGKHDSEDNVIRNYVIAKKGSVDEKNPPYYDC